MRKQNVIAVMLIKIAMYMYKNNNMKNMRYVRWYMR